MSVSLKIEHISKSYDKNIALEDINLDIERGEFVCLLGPSGCGKSTLLRIIAGLEKPNKGNIYINERKATKLLPASRNYGIMFQSYALFPNLTAFENVVYGLRNRKIPKNVIRERGEYLFSMIHLSHAKNKYPSQLSGGEQQRVALARALATEPDFLLLDEPLSALDAKVRIRLRQQIREIQKELQLTTIMVTHDQDEALTMADKIIVMNKAAVMQVGTPEEVYLHPANSFVADFVGSINFLHGAVKDPVAAAAEELFAVRPENVLLSLEPVKDSLQAVITNLEFRGGVYRITLEVDYQLRQENLVADVPYQQVRQQKLQPGMTVYAQISEDEVLHYDLKRERNATRDAAYGKAYGVI